MPYIHEVEWWSWSSNVSHISIQRDGTVGEVNDNIVRLGPLVPWSVLVSIAKGNGPPNCTIEELLLNHKVGKQHYDCSNRKSSGPW